jgi:hypothetical protein
MKKITSTILVIAIFSTMAFSQTNNQDSSYKHHFIGSSLFMLFNFLPDPGHFYQLYYGYRITQKDAIIIEAITWRYHAPLGIPMGQTTDDDFPGDIRDIGIGVAYQRILYKGIYSTVHATPFVQQYFTPEKEKIQTGFQLFCTLRFGYHFKLFKNRMFIEPSIAFTSWPINTNLPESFQEQEDKWPSYFLFEPGLHFGFKF